MYSLQHNRDKWILRDAHDRNNIVGDFFYNFVGRLRRPRASGIIHLMIDWSTCPAVERDPERVSGAWAFRGTRVPVAALFENIEDGVLVSNFVEWFPGVTIEQVRAVLEHAARSALAPA